MNVAAAAARVQAGEGVGYVYDSTDVKPASIFMIVAALPPLLPTPYGIAVKMGNTELADKISKAVMQMATGGSSSDLAKFEQTYFVSAGAAPNPDLAALTADPTAKSALTTPVS